jgi:hypothetical protein
MKYKIDTKNIKVTNAIAGVINGAFETGLNPEWYWIESLNKNGFLNAAFADGEDDLTTCYTPNGHRPKVDWSIRGCLIDIDNFSGCVDGEPLDEERATEIITVTPDYAVEMWNKFAQDEKQKHLRPKADAYLRYLIALGEGDSEYAQKILFEQYEPDGVHDDALAQYLFAGDVIFG